MFTALAVATTIPAAGAILFLVLPRMERWLDESEQLASSRRQVGSTPPEHAPD
jgi:hypothetical protein